MSLLDKFTNEMRIQRELKSQLSDMTYKAFNGTRESQRNFAEGILNVGTIHFETPEDKITKEMILDYQKSEQEKGYINPVSGEKMIYDPIEMGDILVNPIMIPWKNGKAATQEDYDDKFNEVQAKLLELDQVNIQLNEEKDSLQRNKRLIKTAFIQKKKDRYDNVEKVITQLESDIKYNTGLMKRKTNEYKTLQKEMELIQDNLDKNKTEEQIAKNENKKLIQKYTDQFNTLNKNRNSINQDPNESEQEYIDRIKQLQTLNFDPNIFKDRAEIENKNKLKEKLKEIIKTDSVISDILKSFPATQIYNINKFYPAISKKLIKVYGVKNEFTEYKDYVATINDVLNEVEPSAFVSAMTPTPSPAPAPPTTATTVPTITPTASPTAGPSTVPPFTPSVSPTAGPSTVPPFTPLATPTSGPAFTPTTVPPSPIQTFTQVNIQQIDNQTLRIYNTKEIFIKIGIDTTKTPPINVILFSTTNVENTYKRIDFNKNTKISFKKVLGLVGLDANIKNDDYKQVFGKSLDKKDVYNFLKANFMEETTPLKTVKDDETNGNISGWGMKNDDVPKTATFGKNIILLHKLFYKNILAIKDKKMHAVEHFPNVKVSHNLADVIINMCKNIPPTKQTLESLKTSEREIFDLLLYVSGLNKKLSTKKENNVNELKERLKLVEAEIRAGNNNPVAKKELKGIVQKLQLYNCISMNNAKNYLRQFN